MFKTKITHTLGFTLTELVVTTAIMGTLAAVAIPSYVETQAKSKAEKTMSNIAEMGQRLGQLYTELSGQYGAIMLVGTAGSGVPIDPSSYILAEQGATSTSGSGADLTTSTAQGQSLIRWLDIFPTGVPRSPFADMPYSINIISNGSIAYVNTGGQVVVNINERSVITIFDIEDQNNFSMTFAF